MRLVCESRQCGNIGAIEKPGDLRLGENHDIGTWRTGRNGIQGALQVVGDIAIATRHLYEFKLHCRTFEVKYVPARKRMTFASGQASMRITKKIPITLSE